jgi:hypothetical protein
MKIQAPLAHKLLLVIGRFSSAFNSHWMQEKSAKMYKYCTQVTGHRRCCMVFSVTILQNHQSTVPITIEYVSLRVPKCNKKLKINYLCFRCDVREGHKNSNNVTMGPESGHSEIFPPNFSNFFPPT